ncbi:TraB/GumN family protein [Mucilaginibacter segetis]|uniref:TraB/GumN family protein n=1 Tax=Mucilaginibacter segetis TaxID=2793071 RepID=A0A934UPB7_9SPHI|nr:TraB/GumN family protein [Mucilaginibacter segetis]MBK0380965.1 TraB/GumN family protein [Mucilaginibacter segetis]
MYKLYSSKTSQTRNFIATTNFFKKTCTIILLVLLSFSCSWAQQKANYNLLWRISGHGLTKPSYLFGTMHVKDNRVFGFSDSVMLAIKNCQSFALEIHPDTLLRKMFSNMDANDTSRNIRKMLNEEEYEKLAKRFEEKNGYPMGEIDPTMVESMITPVKKRPNDRKSFIDAYLYGVARTMDKNIYGLEHITDPFYQELNSGDEIKSRLQDILSESDEEALDDLEKMTKAYMTGNLTTISEILGDAQLNDPVLISRNNLMAKSIVNLISTQSLFSAVGVAHLIGDEGLISLLRKAGYTLTPVKATFTGVADNYKPDFNKIKWETYTDEKNGYAMDMPSTPIQTNVLYGMNTVIYPDLANDLYFGAYAIKKGTTARPVTPDSLINMVVNNFKSNKKNHIVSNKKVLLNGKQVTDVIMESGDDMVRFRLIIDNNILYCLYAGNNPKSINTPYADRFFNSFKSFKVEESSRANWITFKNDTAAFSISMPFTPQKMVQTIPNPIDSLGDPYQINMYMAADTDNLENYIVRYNDYPKGNYLADKGKLFESIPTEYGKRGKLIGEPEKIFKDGYEGRAFTLIINDKYNCRIQLFVRGNRIYLLLKQNLQERSSEHVEDDFFESFKFLPYLKSELVPAIFDDGKFQVTMFSDPKMVTSSRPIYNSFLKSSANIISTNPVSGSVYELEHATFSKYYRAKDIDSVYNYLIPKFSAYPDSLIKVDTILVNGISGREFIVENSEKEKIRKRLIIDNGDLFYFSGHLSKEELFDETANKIYNSLVKKQANTPISLASSKAELITNDLASADSTTQKYAYGALSYYDFEKDELPYLYKALQKNYPDDTLAYGTRSTIIQKFKSTSDNKTPGILKDIVTNKATSDAIKATILNVITQVDKENGYNTYLDLITSIPVIKTENSYQLFSPMYDSLKYVVTNYSRIIPLLKYPEYKNSILGVTQSVVNQDQYINSVTPYFNQLTATANEDAEKFLNNTDTTGNEWGLPVYYYLQIMNKIKAQPLTAPFTAKLIKKDNWRLADAVNTRISNNLPVEQKLINKLADSIDTRYSLMETLNQENKLDKVALKYRQPVEFAKLNLYQYLTNVEDYGSLRDITLLGNIPDKDGAFYAFKFKLDDDKTEYLGVYGPYKTGIKLDFKSYHAYTTWDSLQTDWQKQVKEMIPKLKEQNAAELKNAEK